MVVVLLLTVLLDALLAGNLGVEGEQRRESLHVDRKERTVK